MAKTLLSALTVLIEIACLTPLAVFSLSAAEDLIPSSLPPVATWAVHTLAAGFTGALALALLGMSVRKTSHLSKGPGHWLLRISTGVYCKAAFLVTVLYTALLVKTLLLGKDVLDTGQQQSPRFLRMALLNNSTLPIAGSVLSHTFSIERVHETDASTGPNLQVYLSSPKQDWLDAALGARGWQTLGTYNLSALNITAKQMQGASSVEYYGVPSTYIPVFAYVFSGAVGAYVLLSFMLAVYLAYSAAPENQQDATFIDHSTLAVASVFLMHGTDRVVSQGYSACAPALQMSFEIGSLSLILCSINLCHGLSLNTLGSIYSSKDSALQSKVRAEKVFAVALGTISFTGASVPVSVAIAQSIELPWVYWVPWAPWNWAPLVACCALAALGLWTYLVTEYTREARFKLLALRVASVASPFMLCTAPPALSVILPPASVPLSELVLFELPGLVILPILAVCAYTRYWPWASHLLAVIPPPLPPRANPPPLNPAAVPAGILLLPSKEPSSVPHGAEKSQPQQNLASAGLFCIPERGFLQQRSPAKRASSWAQRDFSPPLLDPHGLRSQLQSQRSPAPEPYSRQGARSMPPASPPQYWHDSSYATEASPTAGDFSVFRIPQQQLARFGMQPAVIGSRPPSEHHFLSTQNSAPKAGRYTV